MPNPVWILPAFSLGPEAAVYTNQVDMPDGSPPYLAFFVRGVGGVGNIVAEVDKDFLFVTRETPAGQHQEILLKTEPCAVTAITSWLADLIMKTR